ncbi:MAG: methyltransferase domain-containing protein [Caldilineaceae bacterium]
MSYAFDHQWKQERNRLARLEKGMDPGTIRHLEALGVAKGWRCLEIGAGGGSIAEWLCERVGSEGRVVATDLQTKFIEAIDVPNIEVRQHDITTDNLEQNAFDLVHARAVLEHLPARDEVLQRMIAALRPGGWLLLEAHDFLSLLPISQQGSELFTKASNAFLTVLNQNGLDPEYGRRIGLLLRHYGLTSVGVEGRMYEMGGDLPLTAVWSLVVQRLRQPMTEAGLLSSHEIDEAVELIEGSQFLSLSPTFIAGWGRKPK